MRVLARQSPMAASSSSAPPPSSSSTITHRCNYDVSLSFRGPDTRNTFTGHLYQDLCNKGINVFIDNELERGEVISSELLGVIEASRISIVVLSEKYASSSFCLDELVKILECRRSKGQIVLPVFFHVDPSDVKRQSGTFGGELAKLESQLNEVPDKEASLRGYVPTIFREHRNNNKYGQVPKWRSSLTEVATLSGWHLKNGDHEANTIRDIVKKVLKQLDHTPLDVAKHSVGLDSRVEYIFQKLGLESNDVRMVGLLGMGGIGKTTTAKAIYNRCAREFEFDGSSFLLNVRVNSKKNDLAQLQETLLFEILGDQKHLMGNFEKGIELIKERLGGKKVLVVIDDVDHIEQLQKLAGGLEWFGAGSRIIITTRDSHLLKLHGVTIVHEIKELGDVEAMELFSWHAFKEPQPSETYMELSRCVVRYAQGLPLALKVLGSLLFGRDVPQWKGVLKKLKRCPNHEIIDILKVSFDGLDDEEKEIFLDIACFLKGKNKDEVIKFLDACGFVADFGVQRLIEKSLLYVAHKELQMHDLLETMGTRIALDESSHNPPGRRLCIQEEVPRVFLENKRPYDIEGILLDFHGEEEVHFDMLENLKKLRLLIIRNGRVTRMPKSLPNSIRWLEWHECSLKTIPHGFIPAKLIVLEMPSSSILHFEKPFAVNSKEKKFMDLTRVDFNSCEHLRKTVDFSAIPNLEQLNLSHCRKLKKIDKSVGSLKKLEFLYLEECRSLTSLPNLVETQNLLHLSLNGCSKLDELPNLSTSLSHLGLSGTAIKEIPSSIGNLINLLYLFLSGCNNLVRISNSIYKLSRLHTLISSNCSKLGKFPEAESSMISSCLFPNLKTLNLKGCTLEEVTFLKITGCFPQLSVLNLSENNLADFDFSIDTLVCHELDLSGNNFVTLPAYISRFKRLTRLRLVNCKWLVEIPELPHTVSRLCAHNCKSLERFSQFENHSEVDFTNCHKLAENGMQSWTRVILQNLSLISMQKNLWSSYRITLPGNEIPEWFSYTREANASSFKLSPPVVNKNFIGIAWCAIFQVNPELDTMTPDFQNQFWINGFNLTEKVGVENFFSLVSPLESEHMWLCFYNDYYLHTWLQAEEIWCEFNCEPNDAVVYKRFGIHFIYKEDIEV